MVISIGPSVQDESSLLFQRFLIFVPTYNVLNSHLLAHIKKMIN